MNIREHKMMNVLWNQAVRVAALALILCSAATAADTDSHPMRFDGLTLDDGLSQSTVIRILQDSRGLMWFATENGLNSYNGYEFEHFKRDRGNPDALINDFIYDVVEDSDGNLWLATNGGGLAMMERDSERFTSFRHDSTDTNSIAGDVVRSLVIDADGIIWIGTRGAGLDRFDPSSAEFTNYRFSQDGSQSQDADDIYSVYKDSDGIVWAGSEGGLYRLNPESGAIDAYINDPEDATTLSDNAIRAIFEDGRGDLWVGTYGGGLNKFDRKTGSFQGFRHDTDDASSISHDRIAAIFEDTDNRFWIGTSQGLNLMDRDSGEFTRYMRDETDASSLGDNAITSLFQDRGGILWIGTQSQGVNKWNPATWALGLDNARTITADQKSQPNVTSIVEDDAGILWVGTFGDGLNAMNRTDDTVTRLRHDPSDPNSISDDRVMSLMQSRDGALWVGTMTGGVNRLQPEIGSNEIYRHDPSNPQSLGADGIMALFEDSSGLVWVGTFGGGISRFDPVTRQFTNFTADPENPNALSSSRVTSFAEDKNGRMWVGTDAGGLNLFDPQTQSFHHFRNDPDDPKSLADDTVYSLNVGVDGTVWVGTRGGGLDRVIGDAASPANIHFSNLSETDGLANDVIYGIRIDNVGELWLSTNYGISRLNTKTGEIKNMHRSDGLQSEEFNFGAHHRSKDGELFFGGHNGINAFYPKDVQANKQFPLIMLTGLYNAGQPIKADTPVDENEGIEISYQDDVVSFEFAALDFTASSKNEYMYKLEGFDKNWIDLGNRRTVTYTDLSDGNYLLRVKAANSDGVWNDAGFSMPVRVTPAPWDTWWAYLGYLAMFVQVVVLFWLGHKRKIRREEDYSARLEVEVHTRTAELNERNEELKNLNVELQESSLSDPLTGLRNRRFVFDEISRDLDVAQRRQVDESNGHVPKDNSDLVFMMIDLDHFKPINDTYGHAAGDQMLLEVRDVLLSTCRKSDHLVRWGGDEFVLISKQAKAGESEALAERIRSRIAEHNFTLAEGQTVRTTVSIGFAAFPIFRGQGNKATLDNVINMADNLMYEAKRKRNAWAGMLGISKAATSEGFDIDSIEPTSVLFRALHEQNLTQHQPEVDDQDVPRKLRVVR